ncbi:FKBP-type peptidyl-prolyl cis-trans isomerase [Pseudoalteromonas ruthenica]|uniref:FKBP-type peptidyl-prolyl cis-trans isomerase n=1 Tax=Pseudoalteromonas ruthenica TaxID=151081 RepID=UPI000346182A|nr:FKBP-type peptidyl-prolyl cis-trans isomerase [Pseudoalteromonas ruthenica]
MNKQQRRKSAKGSAGFNNKISQDFMSKYATKEAVHTLPSGLMYRVISASDGQAPSWDDTVCVHQRIRLADGTLVDDTYRHGVPEEYEIAEAIDGLQQALQLMPTGARYEFVIPPELAWGINGNGGKVGPNSVMVVDIKLLSFH